MARKQLSPNPMPTWLSNISESSNFSKEELIEGSVYYPGSGIDRSIIHAYSGFAHSFIYSDYGVEKSFVLENFKKLEGYSVLLLKELNGHDDLIGTFQDLTLNREDFYPGVDQSRSISVRLQHLEAKLRHLHDPSDQDFCIWIVYQRRLTANVGHGPERISLLYVRGEGVATYKTIYNKNNLKPIAIVINKADIGFGRNWTLFEQNNGVFERTVLANTAGKPKYLFADDRYDPECRRNYFTQSPYWSDYTTEVPNRSFLQIWENGSIDSAKKIRAQSKKLSKAFINWYNDRALHIWKLYPGIHPYLPKVLGTQFDIDADICYVGMNPSFNTDEIRKMMSRHEFDGFTPESLHQNSLDDIKKRINLLKLLENIAVKEYSKYFKPIRDFHEELDLGFTKLSFLDLFIVRQTKQDDVQKRLSEKKFKEFKNIQLELFSSTLERINTKYICILNAGASSHLCEHLNKGKIATSYEYKGKILFFSGMLSGGAMDRFSRERLKLNIRDVINNKAS